MLNYFPISIDMILFIGFSRQEYWSGLAFPSPVDHVVSDVSTMPTRLGWPHRAWLNFTGLEKAVVLVWLDWLVFCDYGFSVSALWCPLQHLPSYLGFSYLGRGVSLHGCSSKVQLLLHTLDEGYLFTTTPPDLERGIVTLGPLAPMQPPLLGRGVAPPGRHPWPWAGVAPLRCFCTVTAWHSWPIRGRVAPLRGRPWPQMWGSSSWLPHLRHGVLPVSAPDLRHRVARRVMPKNAKTTTQLYLSHTLVK